MHGLKDVPVRWTRENDPDGIDSAFMEVELPSEVSVQAAIPAHYKASFTACTHTYTRNFEWGATACCDPFASDYGKFRSRMSVKIQQQRCESCFSFISGTC